MENGDSRIAKKKKGKHEQEKRGEEGREEWEEEEEEGGVGQGRDTCSERAGEREGECALCMTGIHASNRRKEVVCLEGETNICDFSLGS